MVVATGHPEMVKEAKRAKSRKNKILKELSQKNSRPRQKTNCRREVVTETLSHLQLNL
jgi:hypothetical protein